MRFQVSGTLWVDVLADTVFAAQLGLALLASGGLLQNAHDLLVAERTLFQDRLLVAQVGAESNPSFVSIYGEQTTHTLHECSD